MKSGKPPDDEKGSPGARTIRRVENAEKQEYIIKASLHRTIHESPHKNDVMNSIQRRVEAVSRGTHRLSMAFNILIRTYINASLSDLRKVNIPTILSTKNASHALQIMLGTGRKVEPWVETFLKEWNDKLPSPPERYQGDTNTLVRACEQYLTNFRTYLKTQFFCLQKAFIHEWCSRNTFIPQNEAYLLQWNINKWNRDPNSIKNWETDKRVQKMVHFHRQVLHLDENQMICDKWIEQNYEVVIAYFGLLQHFFIRRTGKGFILAPVSRIKTTFAHIDTNVLHGLMKETKMIDCSLPVFQSLRDEHWKSLLRYENYLTQKQRENVNFTGTIQTDGVSICLHFRRPKSVAKGSFKPNSADRIIGCDPGRSNILTMVEIGNDNRWIVNQLSRGQYYQESGITDANKLKDRWNKGIQYALDELSLHTTKYGSVASFLSYIETVQKHSDVLWGEYLKRRWGRQRFVLYSGKKSTVEKFLSSLDDGSGRRIVLAYGNSSFDSTGKGELSVPTDSMYKACSRAYKTVLIDEFRTTQLHHITHERMSKVVENGKEVRGLRWCGSTKGCKFIDRDINAALNMITCYKSFSERPIAFTRGTETQSTPVVKIIGQRSGLCNKVHREGHLRGVSIVETLSPIQVY